MRENNANYTKIRICLDNRNKFILTRSVKIRDGTMFVELSLNIRVKQRNLATSNDLHSFHPDKKNTFSFLECMENFRQK